MKLKKMAFLTMALAITSSTMFANLVTLNLDYTQKGKILGKAQIQIDDNDSVQNLVNNIINQSATDNSGKTVLQIRAKYIGKEVLTTGQDTILSMMGVVDMLNYGRVQTQKIGDVINVNKAITVLLK